MSTPVLMICAVCLYVSWQFLQFFQRFRNGKEKLAFSFISLTVAVYCLITVALYNSDNPLNSIIWQRYQFVILSLMCIGFAAFFYFIAQYKYRIVMIALGFCFFIFFICNLLISDQYFFNIAEPLERHFKLGQYFQLNFVEVTPGFYPILQYIVMMFGAVIGLVIITYLYFQGDENKLQVVIAMGCFVLATVNDILVGLGIFTHIYLIEFAFLLLMLAMSNLQIKDMVIIKRENRMLNEQMEHKVRMRTRGLQKKLKQMERVGHQTDQITGLPNRKAFFKQFSTDDTEKAILILNLDEFKNINLTYGREVGDELIKIAAERILTLLNDDDYMARLEGAEFAVVKKVTDEQEVMDLAERMSKQVDSSYLINGLNLHVSNRIGVAFYPDHGKSVSSLLINANVALSYNPRKGERYRVFTDEMYHEIHRRNKIVNDLRYAINCDEDQINMVYQPIVDQNKQVIGAEALVRWHHPEEGIVYPIEFISLAEETGMISQLTQIIIGKVCEKLAQWGKTVPYITINISTLDLMEPEFVQMSLEKIALHSLEKKRIRFEITESHVMKDPYQAFYVLEELNRHGIQLLIDDFGTGHSSLSYLSQFPKGTVLKIDRSFMKDLTTGDKNLDIIRTILNLASTFDMNVVAEGVEEPSQFDILKGMGLEKMQGFHFCKPLTPEEFEKRYCRDK